MNKVMMVVVVSGAVLMSAPTVYPGPDRVIPNSVDDLSYLCSQDPQQCEVEATRLLKVVPLTSTNIVKVYSALAVVYSLQSREADTLRAVTKVLRVPNPVKESVPGWRDLLASSLDRVGDTNMAQVVREWK